MEIQELEVKGFRSLRDVRWTPGRLNVLIGPNGSGKSNLLQALELLKRAAENKLSEEILQQGGFSALLWDESAQEISWSLRSGLEALKPAPTEAKYQLVLGKLGSGSSFRVEKESVQIGRNKLKRSSPERIELTDEKGMTHFLPSRAANDQSALTSFLDAFKEAAPTTTVAERVNGETRLSVLDGNDLQRWLERYSLGDLFVSGKFEVMAGSSHLPRKSSAGEDKIFTLLDDAQKTTARGGGGFAPGVPPQKVRMA